MVEYKLNMWCGHSALRAQTEEAKDAMDSIAKSNYGKTIEVIIRVADPRQEWIEKWYIAADCAMTKAAMFPRDNEKLDFYFCKDTVYCVEHHAGYYRTASAAPRHGDKYDRKTGIAVAYAKLRHEKIPDFI